jgi:hypothetical protein
MKKNATNGLKKIKRAKRDSLKKEEENRHY